MKKSELRNIIKEELGNVLVKEGDETIFHVYETDDYGRPDVTLCYVTANTKDEARVKASMHLLGKPNSGITDSGYYGASEITLGDFTKEKEKLEKELRKFNIIK